MKHLIHVTAPKPASLPCNVVAVLATMKTDDPSSYEFFMRDKGCRE